METTRQSTFESRLFYFTLALLLIFYLPALVDLVSDWYTDSNYSHGFFIPVISFFLIWKNRKLLSGLEIAPSRSGLILIAAGIALFILGNGASEYFTVRFSLIVVIFGLALLYFGVPVLRRVWFALAFLVFMIPVPYVLYFSATFPMQLLASKVAAGFLNAIGMPIVRQGNILLLADQALEVAEACSGMRSLVSLLALGALYAYFSQRRLSARIILFAASVPIAIIGNIGRVTVTAIIAHISEINVNAEPLHSILGASVFVIALILLVVFGIILGKIYE